MTISHELAISSKPLKGFLLPMRIVAIDIVENPWFKHKECAIDPAFFGLWLLGKLDDVVADHFQMSEPRGRPNRGESCQLAMSAMKR